MEKEQKSAIWWTDHMNTAILSLVLGSLLRRKNSPRFCRSALLSFGPSCIEKALSRCHRHWDESQPVSRSNDVRAGDLNRRAGKGPPSCGSQIPSQSSRAEPLTVCALLPQNPLVAGAGAEPLSGCWECVISRDRALQGLLQGLPQALPQDLHTSLCHLPAMTYGVL